MKSLLVVILIIPFQFITAQNGFNIDHDFVFKDGIYLSIADLRMNNPIPSSNIVELISDMIDESDNELQERRKQSAKKSSNNASPEKKINTYIISWDEFKSYDPVNLVWIDRVKIKDEEDSTLTIALEDLYAVNVNGNLFIKFNRENIARPVMGASRPINNYFLEVTSIGEVLLLEDDLNINAKGINRKIPSNNYKPQTFESGRQVFYSPRIIHDPVKIKFYIVSMEDGVIYPLQESNILDVIFKDEALYEKYIRDEDQARKVLPYFVKKYNKNNPYFIKY